MSERQLQRVPNVANLCSDDTDCNILHVDMDAFFAMVEVRDRPELKGQPVIVGRSHGRGVVVSATYEARARGIHSAMPMGVARRLFPQAVYIDPSRDKYTAASRDVMAILRDFTPMTEVVSVDEAFLDVSRVLRSIGSPASIGARIRERMSAELDLPCSVGIAPVTMVAKIASTAAKPDGLLIVPKVSMLAYLHSLPVGKLWGVGGSTEKRLESVGVLTVGDIASMGEARLAHSVGKAAAARLSQLAAGYELRPVTSNGQERSIGSEVTFDVDVTDSRVIEHELWAACEGIGGRLRNGALAARQVSIKVRFDDFTTVSRSHTLVQPSDLAAELYAAIGPLWQRLREVERPVRLVGVRVEQISDTDLTGEQLTFDTEHVQRAELAKAMDQVVSKFGSKAAFSARILKGNSKDR